MLNKKTMIISFILLDAIAMILFIVAAMLKNNPIFWIYVIGLVAMLLFDIKAALTFLKELK